MKKFIVAVSLIVVAVIFLDYAYYHLGLYVALPSDQPITTFTKTDGDKILVDRGSGYEEYEIKGVNLGSGIPGSFSTEFAIDEETYLRWFAQMKAMGANTLRVYTIQNDSFYRAFYEYNQGNDDPLYLIHGVWVNDYIQYSNRDAYSKEFYDKFLQDCKIMVDVIHGRRKISAGNVSSAGSGTYDKDISKWVIGYILGVEWEDVTVAYTDETYRDDEKYNSYVGTYLYTKQDSTPFETMLARVGDQVIEYETKRYKQQRLLAFSNWPTTDPFVYPEESMKYFLKCACIDVEHIQSTDQFIAGQFASYHVYPYFPDYLSNITDWAEFGIDRDSFYTADGKLNSYKAYLSLLTRHHTMPVVISEFGVSSGRGMAQTDVNTGRNQGHMSETEQGQALVDCYRDIMDVGCSGGCVFTWQDEWFKRTWNTMYAVDLTRTAYWSDYQTNEQYFALLSFDPGTEESVCYVDGDVSEWTQEDVIFEEEGLSLSVKYDEKFLYFYIHKNDFDFENEKLYLPLDITPKSGSSYCSNNGLKFDRSVDFLITISGKDDSSVTVQERYDALRSTYSENVYRYDTYLKENIPQINSPVFVPILMILKKGIIGRTGSDIMDAETFETGRLLYGNANPSNSDFNSLADFICNGDDIELKLPWQLLNFADPSEMKIHDDYYDGNYGVEFIMIDKIYAGISEGVPNERVRLSAVSMKGWGNNVTYHERLKSSYYIMQQLWAEEKS